MKRRGFLGLLAGSIGALVAWRRKDPLFGGLFREVPLERARLAEVDVEFDPTEWPETLHEHSFEGPSEYRLIERTHADGRVLVHGDGAAVGKTGFLFDPAETKRRLPVLCEAWGGGSALLDFQAECLRRQLRYWPGANEAPEFFRANQGPLPLVRI